MKCKRYPCLPGCHDRLDLLLQMVRANHREKKGRETESGDDCDNR
jgi:hypothetical protein